MSVPLLSAVSELAPSRNNRKSDNGIPPIGDANGLGGGLISREQ